LHQLAELPEDLVGEVIFVDDSDDGTAAAVADARDTVPFRVRCLHRKPGERAGGLSTAVLLGLRAAACQWAAVMDGDLQHPPALLAKLRATAESDDLDLVAATRYARGGTPVGLAGRARMLASRLATGAATAMFPRRLGSVSDPMSGYFLVRLDAIDLHQLRPTGFKILLEILVRSDLRTGEVPFTFGIRQAGDSKASAAEGLRYLLHLLRLRLGRGTKGRAAMGFAAVGASGLAVNGALFWALVELGGLALGLGAALATQGSTLWNFLGNERFVFRGTTQRGRPIGRFARYWAMNCALLLVRVPLIAVLTSALGMHYLLANQLTFAALFGLRFVASDRVIWRRGDAVVPVPDDRAYAHTYDIAGLVTIASEIELRELQSFAATIPEGVADVEVRRGIVGSRLPGRPSVEISAGAVTYTEHLGGYFSNFSVDLGGPIKVTVGHLLAASPHVVYTNVVEALLRFVLVSRGHMLLHSACFVLDGRGVMLSARTDTGKTGTILRLVRERGAVFLSDDMTIVSTDGTARSYPKPLTISAHTLRAVKASPLGRIERVKLNVQSRVHSKGGRSIGAWLAERNLPIMSFNAFVQVLIPPPKYMVHKLVDATYGTTTRVEELFVIERGAPALTSLDRDQARVELLENTDDAYGFPPFAQFAPAIAINGDGYLTLRAKEEAVLARFLDNVRVRRLASDSFSWADDIPALLADDEPKVLDLTVDLNAPEVIDLTDDHEALQPPVAEEGASSDRIGLAADP
jgi:putative flippase GtrA